MTCQHKRGLSHSFYLTLRLQGVSDQWGSTSYWSQAPEEWLWDGAPAAGLTTVVPACLGASFMPEGLEHPDTVPALQTLPCNLVTPWQARGQRSHPQPHAGAPGDPCDRAIKENCGGAAWCQGASHPPHKAGVPWGESGRQRAHSPECQPFSWREGIQQFSLMLPQTADAKNTLRSGPSFLRVSPYIIYKAMTSFPLFTVWETEAVR